MTFFLGGHFEFFFQEKKNCCILLKRPKAFIRGIIFFCTMDGFFRILEKTSSELICTRLYVKKDEKNTHGKFYSPSVLIIYSFDNISDLP